MQSLNPEHQLKSVEDIFPKNLSSKEAKDKTDRIKTMEPNIVRDDSLYKTGNKKIKLIFKSLKLRSFGREIC